MLFIQSQNLVSDALGTLARHWALGMAHLK